jgi:hypothetical protein
VPSIHVTDSARTDIGHIAFVRKSRRQTPRSSQTVT